MATSFEKSKLRGLEHDRLFMNPRLQELAEESFRQKKERRRELAALPIEEKVEILRRLQQVAAEIAWEARGVKLNPWPVE
jgi:hypothetical protein